MTGPLPLDQHAVADDPFLRWHLGADPAARTWRVGGAIAIVTPRGDALGLVALGSPGSVAAAVAAAAADLRAEGVGEVRLSLPPGVEAPVARRVGEVNAWEWMWAETLASAPPATVGWLVDTDREIADLLAYSPRAHARPGDEGVRGWAGVRHDGLLVAAGALCSAPSGTPHLRGIVTHPERRGAGLGAAVTAYLTAAGLREGPVVTLGMYSENDVARRIYHRLGFTTSHRWVSSRATW